MPLPWRPGLRQCDQPSRPQRARGQPCRVVSQKALQGGLPYRSRYGANMRPIWGPIWGHLRLGTWVLLLHVTAAGLFTCCCWFFFLLQPNPIAEGSTQGPLQTDGGQSSAGVVWDGPPASPFAWSFLITHQPEPDSPRKNSSPAPPGQALSSYL